MKKILKSVKKLALKSGDFLVVTLKGEPTMDDVWRIKEVFSRMKFLKGIEILFVNENITFRRETGKQGKHKVYLNNLEYLEHLSKRKGE